MAVMRKQRDVFLPLKSNCYLLLELSMRGRRCVVLEYVDKFAESRGVPRWPHEPSRSIDRSTYPISFVVCD